MNTIDIEIRGAQPSSGQTDLSYFLQYLDISVHHSLMPAQQDNLNRSTTEISVDNIETCVLNLNSFARKKQIATLHQDYDLAHVGKTDGYFYFRTHNFESLSKIYLQMETNINFRIYLLCHNLFDVLTEHKRILLAGIDPSRITFIFSKFNQSLCFHSSHKLKNVIEDIKYNEVFFLNPRKKNKPTDANETRKRKLTPVFYFLIKAAQFSLEPIKNSSILLQKSNMIWLLRFKELIDFTLNLIQSCKLVLLMCGFKFFGIFVDSYYVLRLIVIRSAFIIRHVLLMCGFKSFGVFVDSYYVLRLIAMQFIFIIRHVLLMCGFKSFGIFVDSYYVLRLIVIRSVFIIKHVLLMCGFKSFGVFVDSYYFLRFIVVRSVFIIRHVLLMCGFKSFGIFVDSYYFLRFIVIRSAFIIRHVVLMCGFKTFGVFVDSYYFLRLIVIRSAFIIRHVVLMCGFKTFGVFVDSYYFLRLIVIRSAFIIRHVLLLLMCGFKTFGVFVDIFQLGRFLLIKMFYFFRHVILMSIYKSYGFAVDAFYLYKNLLRNILNVVILLAAKCGRILLNPAFKIYWFICYQYKKRIKKSSIK